MKRFLIFSAFFLAMQGIVAQSFSDYFEDKTLRIDYTFSGNHDLQHIEVSELKKSDGWYGRRHNLDSLPLRGNGQIYMKHKGKVVYATSFSSLFQEWLTTEESTKATKSFENTFLLPFPKDEMDVTINLTNTHNKVVSELTYHINPKDILIRQMKPNKEQKTRYIHKGGDPKECIDVVIVAEGYTESELETFFKDAEIASESLFAHAPFSANKSKFNILAVGAVSKDSGVSIPRLGQWKNTALSSHFSTFYSDRYLTTLHLKDLPVCHTSTSSSLQIPTNTAAAEYTTRTPSQRRTTSSSDLLWFMNLDTVSAVWPTSISTTTSTRLNIHRTPSHGNRTSQRWLTSEANGRICCLKRRRFQPLSHH